MKISKTKLDNLTFKDRWKYLTQDANPEKLQRFLEYHKANRKVFDILCELAEAAWDKGALSITHWSLFNQARDMYGEFKLSNDYFALYARMLIAKRTKFVNVITIKGLKK